jgi:hypothetical protein
MWKREAGWLVLSVMLGLTVACGGGQMSSAGKLQMSVDTFNEHMRWGRYDAASSHLIVKDREAFMGRYDELGEDYKVVDYEVKSVKLQPNGDAVSETVVKWLREPNMTVKKDKVRETWRYFDGTWLMIEREIEPVKKGRRASRP